MYNSLILCSSSNVKVNNIRSAKNFRRKKIRNKILSLLTSFIDCFMNAYCPSVVQQMHPHVGDTVQNISLQGKNKNLRKMSVCGFRWISMGIITLFYLIHRIFSKQGELWHHQASQIFRFTHLFRKFSVILYKRHKAWQSKFSEIQNPYKKELPH